MRMSPDSMPNGSEVMAFAQNQREEVRDLNGLAVTLNAEPGTHQQTYLLTSSAADSPARTSQLPVNERDSMEKEASCSMRQPESLTLFSGTEDGCSLRTFPDSFPQTVAETSLPFSRRWPNSGFTTSLGECWTADTSECPRGGGGFSSLPDVLEGIVPDRFYLSPKAAAGILRRSQKRERELPVALLDALMILSARYKAEESADTESEQKQPQGANS